MAMSRFTKARSLFDPPIVQRALIDSFKKLDPRHQVRNPVMFVVFVSNPIHAGPRTVRCMADADTRGWGRELKAKADWRPSGPWLCHGSGQTIIHCLRPEHPPPGSLARGGRASIRRASGDTRTSASGPPRCG